MTQLPTGTRQERFEGLLAEHTNIVFKVANTYSRHPEDRRDLAQEIRMQLWRAFPSYDPERRFSTWMYRIALNVAISHARSASIRRQQTVDTPDDAMHGTATADGSQPMADPDERIAALHRFIGELDALNRALLLLYLEDRSYAEIAAILGISASNVATRLNRLKQRIRLHFSVVKGQGTSA